MFVFDKWLDKCASEISQIIIDRTFVDVDSLKLAVKTTLCNSLDKEMKRLDDDLTESLQKMKQERQDINVPSWRKKAINVQEQGISLQRKKVRTLWSAAKEKTEYVKLKQYVRQKFGEEYLQEFIETLKSNETDKEEMK